MPSFNTVSLARHSKLQSEAFVISICIIMSHGASYIKPTWMNARVWVLKSCLGMKLLLGRLQNHIL